MDQASFGAAHSRLVQRLKNEGSLRSELIENAFRKVPRHLFLPGLDAGKVYGDSAIVTKSAGGAALSSSSQPSLMALMLEQLQLRPGHRVLEIGAGTGYNAALMANIVGRSGAVVTLDIDEDIVSQAKSRLAQAGYEWVTAKCRDGSLGAPEHAPFDRIILAIGTRDLSQSWLDQMKPDGLLVVPLSLTPTVQVSVAFTPAEGALHSLSVAVCEFIPIRGALAFEPTVEKLPLTPDGHLALRVQDAEGLDPARLLRALSAPGRTVASRRLSARDLTAFDFWLRLQPAARWCMLVAGGEWAKSLTIPTLWGLAAGQGFTGGLVNAAGLCLLTRPTGPAARWPYDPTAGPEELLFKSYGDVGDLSTQMLDLLSRWQALGSPGMEQLRITMLKHGQELPPSPARQTIVAPLHNFALEWV